jgi:hypothetical protein
VPSPQPDCYSIRLSQRFEAQVLDLFGSFERWDEIADALYRVLPLKPSEFPVVPNTGYRAVTLETNPRRTVFFVIDEGTECVEFDAIG